MPIINPDVLEMVTYYLKAQGYDGLFNTEYEPCGCDLEDLVPCGEIQATCIAGYKHIGCTCGEGCDFHINSKPMVDDENSQSTKKDPS